ncbi:hypothetical protein GCM10010503_14590 [Streptomyces lucensis JCM 4490]|uniref:Uncharacterized protein n=1 Tax=Streptomyces lucensis JCM 4490 TaxID=1306176 RepID=A0A918J175_9ACTN|nr:hypothetical protein GCM10010503_14590 [Streptomyces lucensis JCM 4490]
MTVLGHAAAVLGGVGQFVAVEHDDVVHDRRQRRGGEQAGRTGAYDNSSGRLHGSLPSAPGGSRRARASCFDDG